MFIAGYVVAKSHSVACLLGVKVAKLMRHLDTPLVSAREESVFMTGLVPVEIG